MSNRHFISPAQYARNNPKHYISEIQDISEETVKKKYLYITTNKDHYLVDFNSNSLDKIKSHLKYQNQYNKRIQLRFKIGSVSENSYNRLPFSSTIELEVPLEFQFEYALIGKKATFIDPDQGVIHLGSQEILYRNVYASIKRPSTIKTPEIRHSNINAGYYIEEYIDGNKISKNNIRSIEFIQNQLLESYENIESNIDIEYFLKDIGEQLTSKGYVSSYNSFIENITDKYDLPNYLNKSFIHGELSLSNILIKNRDFYVMDWTFSRTDYTFIDAYYPYFSYQNDFERSSAFEDMIEGEGRFHKRHKRMVEIMGEVMYNSKKLFNGIPLVFISYILAYYENADMNNIARSVFKKYI